MRETILNLIHKMSNIQNQAFYKALICASRVAAEPAGAKMAEIEVNLSIKVCRLPVLLLLLSFLAPQSKQYMEAT